MQAFLLTPVELPGACWETSTVRAPLWVLAVDEQAARRCAVEATVIAFINKREIPSPALGSPWSHAHLATCEPRECPFDLRPGVVVNEHREPVAPEH